MLSSAHIFRGDTLRNISRIVGASFLGKALLLLATPVLARQYSPEAFGHYGAATAIAGLVSAYGGLSYHAAIVASKSDDDAETALGVAATATFATSLTGVLIIGFVAVNSMTLPEKVAVACGIILGIFLSIRSILVGWLGRIRSFTVLANSSALYPAASALTQTLFGFGGSFVGLIGGAFVGRLMELAYLRHRSRAIWSTLPTTRRALRLVLQQANRLRAYPVFQTPQRLLAESSQAAPLLLLTAFGGPAVAGIYVLADRLIRLPYNMLANSMHSVIYAEVSSAVNAGGGAGKKYIASTSVMIAIIAIPAAALAYVLLPLVLPPLLGNSWMEAVPYGQALLFSGLGAIVARPGIAAMPALNRQGTLLLLDAARATIAVGLLALGLVHGRYLLAIYLYSISQGLLYLITTVVALICSGSAHER